MWPLGLPNMLIGSSTTNDRLRDGPIFRVDAHVNLTINSLVLLSEALGLELDIVLQVRRGSTVNRAQSE